MNELFEANGFTHIRKLLFMLLSLTSQSKPPIATARLYCTAILRHVCLSLPQQELIIALLSNAVAQFKKYKCPRMKSHLSEYNCSFLWLPVLLEQQEEFISGV